MARHERFHLEHLDALRQQLAELGLTLPIDEDLSVLAEPVAIGPHQVPNRFAVQPMEGFDAEPDGSPGELALRRYRRFAAGGSGLIWFEAASVVAEGRSNPRQLWLHEASCGAFRRLVTETREAASREFGEDHQPLLVLQLTHSGRFSRPGRLKAPG